MHFWYPLVFRRKWDGQKTGKSSILELAAFQVTFGGPALGAFFRFCSVLSIQLALFFFNSPFIFYNFINNDDGRIAFCAQHRL